MIRLPIAGNTGGMNRWKAYAPIAFVLGMVLGVAGCGHGIIAAHQSTPRLIAEAQEPYMIRAAVVRALQARRYVAEADVPGRIIARYESGGMWFRVAVDYSPTQFQINYIDSAGLETYVEASSGALMIDGRYGRWTARLAQSIDVELERPYREAAQAAAAQREYELAVARETRRAAEAQRDEQLIRAQPAPPAPPPVVVQPVIPVVVPDVGLGGGVNVQRNYQNSSSSQTLTCCINGAYYSCPGQAAFQECMSTGPSPCTRDASRDGQCH